MNGSFSHTDDGYEAFTPTPTTLELLNALYKMELDSAYADTKEDRAHKLKLLAAAEGIVDAKKEKASLTIPISKRIINQIVAWTKNTIMQRRPLISVEPDSPDSFQVMIQDPEQGVIIKEKGADEVAKVMEAWLEYKFRKRIDFDTFVEVACLDAQQGQTPTWGKVVHDRRYRMIRGYKATKAKDGSVFVSKEEDKVLAGEPNKILNVSTYNMLMPADEQDEQESRWLAEYCPRTSSDLRRMYYQGETPLLDAEAFALLLRSGLSNPHDREDIAAIAKMDKRVPGAPINKHEIWEVWFRRWLKIEAEDEAGKKTLQTKEVELCGFFHRGVGKFLYIYKNPYDHGKRPYVPIFQKKKPHRHSGGSTCEDTLPFQKLISQLSSLEIRNAIKAVTQVVWARPGSSTANWLEQNQIEPGSVIPRDSKDDAEPAMFGGEMGSLINLMDFFNREVEKMTQVGDLQLGLEIPGRTPVGTVQSVMNSGATQAAMFLDSFRRDISKVVQMYVQTCQQYSRFGETIPFRDPETKQMLELVLNFPMEAIHNQFSFAITASSDDQTNQAKFQQAQMLAQAIDADNLSSAQIFGPMISGQTPPEGVEFMKALIERKERLVRLMFNLSLMDGDAYAISPELIDAAIAAQQQRAAEMQAAQAQQAAGAPQEGQPGQEQQGAPLPPDAGTSLPPNQDQSAGLGGPPPQPGLPGQPPGA